jgi:DNA-binding transcriptional ArsR family regulator
MVLQDAVLKVIALFSKAGGSTSYKDLVRAFDLSPEAACGHLERLWQNRLIETTSNRPPRHRFRRLAGERVRGLSFRVTRRGQARLRWKAAQHREAWL